MENNKIYKSAKRLSIVAIIIGLGILVTGLSSLGLVSHITTLARSLFIYGAVIVLVSCLIIICGIRIKKNIDNLSKVKSSLVFIFIISIIILLGSIPRLFSQPLADGPLVIVTSIVLVVLPGLLFFDSMTLLSASKKSQTQI